MISKVIKMLTSFRSLPGNSHTHIVTENPPLIKYHRISSVEYSSQDSLNLGIPSTQVCNIIGP